MKRDDIVEEFANKVGNLNKNLNFINTIGKEKEREYVHNTAIYLAREEGIKRGRAEGRLEGIEQGIEQGVEL